MKAVITVVGKDMVGILAKVSTFCASRNVNVLEVTQSVLSELFTMVMLVEISKLEGDFVVFGKELSELGDSLGLKIHAMHEDIFNSMHKI